MRVRFLLGLLILGRNMQVYSVGEFCQHEGGGWSLLVADNENAFANIKKIWLYIVYNV